MSVFRSLTVVLWMNEKSLGSCGLLSWGPGQLYPLLPQARALTRASAHSWAGTSPPQTAFLPSHPDVTLCAIQYLFCSHSGLSIVCKSLSYLTDFMSLYTFFHFYQFGSFPHFKTSVLIPTFSPKPSSITQAMVFFLPRTLKAV